MSSKKLDYQGRAFSDSDLQELPLKDVAYPYEEVNFSQNQLSAEGLRKVLDLCSRCEHLRVLKLYKNDINDDAAQALGRFVRRCYSLEELHLSHNRFTERGVEMLVKAAQEARDAVDGGAPMWMRLEQNEVSNPDQVLADLQNRYSVCSKKNRTKCSNRHCIYDCKVHLPHFHFQRDEFGQANNEGPRKRKWDGHGGHGHHETNDSWKESDWREGRDDWFDGRPEVFRKDWEDWQQVEPQERPTTGVKMSGGIFMRAMGAIVQNKDDTEDGRPGETKSRRTAVPNNVASRTLNQLGVLAEPRTKVLLKEAPSGIKDEEEDQDEDEEGKVSEDKDEEEEEMEGEVEEERGRPSRGSPPARELSRRRGGRHEANDRRTERRVQEKRRAQQQQQSRRHRDEGRRDGRDGREHNRRERERRRAPERSEHRSRSRGRRGHTQRTRSRERRRAQEEKRSQRERERHGRRPRGERREERGERREERAERREERTERAERPRRRDERAAAGERTEKLLEKIQTGREKASTKALATKQEPNDHKAPPVAFVATRAKAAPRRPAAPAAPAYAATAPRPKGRAPAPAPKVAAKAAADGNESEYTYTEASEYTYEDVEGEEEEEAVDVEDDESDE